MSINNDNFLWSKNKSHLNNNHLNGNNIKNHNKSSSSKLKDLTKII